MGLLMAQVLAELERHESRRAKLQSRVTELERLGRTDPVELAQARADLLTATERALLFDAQRQVLEGKQRITARFVQRLGEIAGAIAGMGGTPAGPTPAALPWQRPGAAAPGPPAAPIASAQVLELRSQEDLRRDIVRQVHDGPAQSLANIALQAEIVDRLVSRGDGRAHDELESMRQMVQVALDATKEFIFEVRPMVLDDLGLVPTLRRAALDRSRRTGVTVDFDSRGVERRLSPDLESALFRSVDEAVAGYVALRPPSVVVRLDWMEVELVATVEGTWPRPTPSDREALPPPGPGRPSETPPVLLAMMEEKRSEERQARLAARSLPAERLAAIGRRAQVLGMSLTIRDEGQVIELAVRIPRT